METKHSINQMADILVDWCEVDLALVEPGNPTRTAQEMVRCMLFTLASDGTARDLFKVVSAANDQPTADLLTQRLDVHEKTAWMLRSLLEA